MTTIIKERFEALKAELQRSAFELLDRMIDGLERTHEREAAE